MANKPVDAPSEDDPNTNPNGDEPTQDTPVEDTPPEADPKPDQPPADPDSGDGDSVDKGEPDGGDEGDPADSGDDPNDPPMSRRQELRFQQLIKKLKEKDQPPTVPSKSEDQFDYDNLEADPELIEQLKAESKRREEHGYSQGVEQAKSIRFHTRLEIDAPKVEAKYPQLDKDSEEFNPALADTINQMYLNTVGFDENTGFVQTEKVRYADFVESMFELSDEMGRRKVEDSRRQITSQAAKAGPRPSGSAPQRLNLNKAPQDMTDEELKAYLKTQGLGS